MITIEMIDEVMEKTGAEYTVVKEALKATDGDVDSAVNMIAAMEFEKEKNKEISNFKQSEKQEKKEKKSNKAEAFAQDIIDAIKDIWEKGNASNLSIEKDGKTILDLSLTVGAIGLVLAPVVAVIGLGAALISEYTIKIQLDNGEVVNVNEFAIRRKKEKVEKEVKTEKEEQDENN